MYKEETLNKGKSGLFKGNLALVWRRCNLAEKHRKASAVSYFSEIYNSSSSNIYRLRQHQITNK